MVSVPVLIMQPVVIEVVMVPPGAHCAIEEWWTIPNIMANMNGTK
jgi:hypothetical protein